VSVENELRSAASARGAKVEDRGGGHFHIIGDMLVNYWPLSKSRTAHISGSAHGTKHVSIAEAVAMAFKVAPPPSPLAHLQPASNKPPKGFRKVSGLFRKQGGLCSLCAQPMILVNMKTLPKPERKQLFKDRSRIALVATIDHTLPRSKARGVDNNQRAAHHACNGIKADQLIEPYPLPCYEAQPLPKIWLAPGVFLEMEQA
jgi:hypothetical protein